MTIKSNMLICSKNGLRRWELNSGVKASRRQCGVVHRK